MANGLQQAQSPPDHLQKKKVVSPTPVAHRAIPCVGATSAQLWQKDRENTVMTFLVENYGVVKGVDDLHTGSGVTCGEASCRNADSDIHLAMDVVYGVFVNELCARTKVTLICQKRAHFCLGNDQY